MNSSLIKFFIVFGMALSVSGCIFSPQEKTEEACLQVGTNFGYPPYVFSNEQGEPVGFDVDLMNEIGKVLGKKIISLLVALQLLKKNSG
jgi:polar amino acid transport system substrate-binding protein